MRQTALLLLASVSLAALAGHAVAGPEPSRGPEVPIRVGDHAGFGRVVFGWNRRVAFELARNGDRLAVHFQRGAPANLVLARRPLRNAAAIALLADGAEITLRPGVQARSFRDGNRVVIDLLDPATEPRPAPVVTPVPAGAVRAGAAAEPVASAAPTIPSAASGPAPARRPDADPVAAASPAPARPARVDGTPVLFAFASGTGAALLPRGGSVLAAFDSAGQVDGAALLARPELGFVDRLDRTDITVLRFRPPTGRRLRLRPDPRGWLLDAAPEAEPAPIEPVAVERDAGFPSQLSLRPVASGHVLTIADPDTGLPLLLGTALRAGSAMPQGRQLPLLDLLPTQLGVAVLPKSDSIELRADAERFLVAAAGGTSLSIGVTADRPSLDAGGLSRVFDLPSLSVAALQQRLQSQQANIAAAPPLARGQARLAAAETLLALGLGREAQALLQLAIAEDPRTAADPEALALLGAAAVLGGRPAEADGLMDARLAPSDELSLWRALRAAALRDRAGTRPLQAALPLLLAYPAPLRQKLLPVAADMLLEGGDQPALRQLLAAAAAQPALDLVRARLAEANGQVDAALSGYDAVAQERDRRSRARALRAAVELRLRTGVLTAAAAAAALEASLYAWRGDGDELATRLRVAELKRQAGDAPAAFALLRDTEAALPADRVAVQAALRDALRDVMEHAPASAALALFDANPTLRPDGKEGEAATVALAERLVAIDLTGRAADLLRDAIDGTDDQAAKGRLGVQLASLRLDDGDADGALDALARTAAPDLDGPLTTQRTILDARARFRKGDSDQAVALVQQLGNPGAATLAEFLAQKQDWKGAAEALFRLAQVTLPPDPQPVTDADRRLLTRLAAYAALAGDEARLRTLRQDYAGRLRGGALAEAFTILTTDPVRGLAALPQLQREIDLVSAMPARLQAFGSNSQAAR